MAVITISRQLGAGETSIAPAVASRWGWDCIDSKLLDREIEESGIKAAAHYDERVPGLVESWQHPLDAGKYFYALKRIAEEYAARGNVVIVGRGANFLLRGTDALHVRLVADMPFRIRRVMEIRWINEQPARDAIAQSDRDRLEFCKRHFKGDWNDPIHYDLSLNTAQVGVDAAAELIVKAAVLRWPDLSAVAAPALSAEPGQEETE